MQILDPGHKYRLTSYDGDAEVVLTFLKREGPGYPGNVGSYAGTNMQETLRALIDRVHYVNAQIPDKRNDDVILHLQSAIALLESRAAERHGIIASFSPQGIESLTTCQICGHIECHHSQ